MSRTLISPRGRAEALEDLGERSVLVGRQRVGGRHRLADRLRRWARTAGLVGLVAAAGGGVGVAHRWATTDARFAVTAVEVRGTSRLAPDEVRAAAKIAPGTNLWRLDPVQVRARVEGLPGIRRAAVVRELPNRVTILVEERRPFTLVHAGRLHWLDEDGRALGEERRAIVPDVPVISGLSEAELDTMRTAPAPRARAAIALIRTLLRSGSALTTEISEIDMSRPEGPVLYTVDGVEVHLGTEQWEERLARLEGVLGQVATRDVTVVDLRFRDQVVLRRGSRP